MQLPHTSQSNQATQTFQVKPLSAKLVSILAIATLATALSGCGGGGGGSADTSTGSNVTTPSGSNTPPVGQGTSTFNVKGADLLYTTAKPLALDQLQSGLQSGLQSKTSALPRFVDGRNAGAKSGFMAGLAANSSAFNLLTVGKDGILRQTIESPYLNRVLYTVRPPNFNSLEWRNLEDPNVYIAFTSDSLQGDTNNYSDFIVNNLSQPCALYRVNTTTNESGCALANVEPVPYADAVANRDWGLFDGSSRKPIQFDAQGNIYVVGYPIKVSNGKVIKEANARLYKIEHDTYVSRPLTQDNESVVFFAIFPGGEPVVALKRDTGMDLVLIKTAASGDQRITFAQGISNPFINIDTYRTLIYGGASNSKAINFLRTSNSGMERASIDYTTDTGSKYNFVVSGTTYTNPAPQRVISGDDGKFYTVFSGVANSGNALLVYQTLPFKKDAVAVIPVNDNWWSWMRNRPIQIKRGILYYATTVDRANIGSVDIIKVVRLSDGTTQSLFADQRYRIDSWKAVGDSLYFSGIANDVNQVIQGQVNTKKVAQQSNWADDAWKAFTPYTVKATASATAAIYAVQDIESMLPQQPGNDPGMQPAVSAFESTDKAAYLSFTKYMNMAEVERLVTVSPSNDAITKVAVFPVWGYQSLHLVYDTSNNGKDSLSDNVAKGLSIGLAGGTGSFDITSYDNLTDAYGWSVPKISYKVSVKDGSYAGQEIPTVLSDNGIYILPVITGLYIDKQPSSQTVIAGRTATFTVSVSGTQPITYQWKKNGSNIEEARTSSYTTPATAIATDNNAVFTVTASNSVGSVTSTNAILTVNPIGEVAAPVVNFATIDVVRAAFGTQNVVISGSGFTASSVYQKLSNGGAWTTGAPGTFTFNSASSLTVVVDKSLAEGTFLKLRVCSSASANASCSSGYVAVNIGDTKSSGNRYSLVASFSKEECVKDDATGLIWEGKPASGLRSESNTYTNYDSSYAGNTNINVSTNSIGYVNTVNSSAVCGFSDWRMPTKDELLSIVEKYNSPTINVTWFPNTSSSIYWSSTHSGTGRAWTVYFYGEYIGDTVRSNTSPIRLVRTASAISAAPEVNAASIDVIRAASGTQAVSIGGSGFSASSVYHISNNHGVWTNGAAGTLTFNSESLLTVAVDKTLAEGTFLRLRVCSSSSANARCSTNYVAVNIGNTQSSGNRYSAVGSFTKEECVKDDATGLIWEGKTASGTRAGSNRYTNYDSTSSAQKWNGSAYVNPTQSEIDASTNSIGYKNAVNTSALCGYTDWRMPTKEELQGILASSGNPKIDTTWFPNTQASGYWSLSPNVGYSGLAWVVYFDNGYVGSYNRSDYDGHVRLVR